MELLRRQSVTYQVLDDQCSQLWGKYTGNWTRYYNRQGFNGYSFNNYTYTATPNPGALLSVTFSGSQAWIYGSVLNANQTTDFPIASYVVDGTQASAQTPYYYSSELIYFQTPKLLDGTHTIDITVTTANTANQYILDYITITPSEGRSSTSTSSRVTTSTRVPPSVTTTIVTTQSTPVGPIVGGVVGGVAGIAIVITIVFYFMMKRARGQNPYYFEKPSTNNVLAGEAPVQPFNPTTGNPPPSAGFNPQNLYYDSGSNQPLNRSVMHTSTISHPSQPTSSSGPTETGLQYTSTNTTGPSTGKATLSPQRRGDVQEAVRYRDSGIRFSMERGQDAGPSQPPTEFPPTYTPH